MDFFLLKLPDTICVRNGEKTHCRAHYLFWPNFFWTKTVKAKRHHKTSGFWENCPKPKTTPFFEKDVFDMGEKVGFTVCFEKLCSSENTIVIVFSDKHSSCIKKAVC